MDSYWHHSVHCILLYQVQWTILLGGLLSKMVDLRGHQRNGKIYIGLHESGPKLSLSNQLPPPNTILKVLHIANGSFHPLSWLIVGLRPANDRRRYFVTTSLIGWAHTYNQPCLPTFRENHPLLHHSPLHTDSQQTSCNNHSHLRLHTVCILSYRLQRWQDVMWCNDNNRVSVVFLITKVDYHTMETCQQQ